MSSYATLISGGVDSSVVVHLLKEQGITPELFYIRIGMEGEEDLTCTAEEDIEMATFVAQKYGCKLNVVDLQKEYWEQVVSYTMDRVKRGLTPNPDVMCNKLIKFGCFEERWGHAFDYVATGHYARTIEQGGKVYLATAKDPIKDQTDFLAQLSYDQIRKTIFPIGDLMKEEVRRIALDNRLVTAGRKDSQGICFLGKINYNDFVRRFLGEKEGDIIEWETGRKLGRHKGFWFHTIGQRKGLGLSQGPWFVVKKDIEQNIVYVSGGEDPITQYKDEFRLADFHFITENPYGELLGEEEIRFKIRHTSEFMVGHLRRLEDGRYHVRSEKKIQGVAPGQFGVLYDRDAHICLGSGEICY